jgi:pimeloyl-ACP methyl ester carboxylesterase
VLVLHGGASRGDRMMVSPTQLSVIRMVPTAKAAARAGRGRLAVYRLLNTWRGWDGDHTPVADARWALGLLREELGELPVGLIGHSLGGRAALLAGDQPGVVSVVALNPWVYPTDDADLTGRRVLVVHGLRDRVASPARARAVARNLARTADVELVEIADGRHAMLRHGREFDRRAATFTAETLLSRV